MLLVLIGGFRYAVMVPAELVANWSIRMAWRGDERGYLAGVKRAAFLSTVVVPSLVLLPLHVALFGATTALVHALFGCLFGVAALDGLFLGGPKTTVRLRLSAARRPEAAVVGRGRDLVARALRLCVHRTGRVEVAGLDSGARRDPRRNRAGHQDHPPRSTT